MNGGYCGQFVGLVAEQFNLFVSSAAPREAREFVYYCPGAG